MFLGGGGTQIIPGQANAVIRQSAANFTQRLFNNQMHTVKNLQIMQKYCNKVLLDTPQTFYEV